MRRLLPRHPITILAAASAAAVLVICAATVGARVALAPDDRIPPGVSIAGVPVGGMTPAQAELAVRELAGPPSGTVEIDRPGERGFPLRVEVAELAPIPRARVAVAEAMRRPGTAERLQRELGFGTDRDIPLTYRVAGAPLQRTVGRVRELIDTDARDASVRVSDGRIETVPSRDGAAVRATVLRNRLRHLPERVVVPVRVVEPQIANAAARSARTRALRMAGGPITVTGAGLSTRVARQVMIEALRFAPTAPTIATGLDPDVIEGALRPVFGAAEREPVSATFRVQGPRVAVVPGRNGRALNAAGVARALERGSGRRSVRVRMTTVEPERTTTAARQMGIRELVSSFTTPYTCCAPRVTNIKRAAEIMDGTIIPAGGSFSLNEVLGQRTTEAGFVPAPQINEGRYEDAVGGGVSQIATTTFNAAFFAGLNLVSHMPHTVWIARYPPGREATVSWGGPELIFENDWPSAILVKAVATDEGVTVRMYSSMLGRKVATKVLSGDPVEGAPFTITYDRQVTANGQTKRDETFTWTYQSAPPAD